jgi:branched-chain amino acid transport system substrate-binding protein
MKRSLASILGGLALAAGLSGAALAQETIKFAMPQDFTAVYTFVTGEYNQGQRDYLSLVNAEGGLDGRKFEALVSDTGNQPQRGIEGYNRARDQGAILFDFLSTPVSRALVPQALQD